MLSEQAQEAIIRKAIKEAAGVYQGIREAVQEAYRQGFDASYKNAKDAHQAGYEEGVSAVFDALAEAVETAARKVSNSPSLRRDICGDTGRLEECGGLLRDQTERLPADQCHPAESGA